MTIISNLDYIVYYIYSVYIKKSSAFWTELLDMMDFGFFFI